jgi:hypothetical protein
MDTPIKHLLVHKRRASTVEAVIKLSAEQNPSDITTSAIAKRRCIVQVLMVGDLNRIRRDKPMVFVIYSRGIGRV